MSERPETLFTRLSRTLRIAAGIALFVVVGAVALVAPAALGFHPALGVVTMLLAQAGLWLALDLRRYPPTTFGVQQRVEYAVAREGACDDCGRSIAAGERRRYLRQVVAFGVPLHTLDWGVNAYCMDCRNDPGSGVEEGSATSAAREREPAVE